MKENSTTMHLMIIWSNADSYKDYIINEIDRDFTIYKIFKVYWDKELFSDNLSVFYSHSLKDFSVEKAGKIIKNKLKNIGAGSFYAIVFEDKQPAYKERNTTSGNRIVNTTVFDKKTAFRKMTGGGSLIHCSDDAWETNKDLTILFGLSLDDFLAKYPCHSKEIEEYKGNCKGIAGYNTVDEMYYVLNNTVNYCMLPGHSIPVVKQGLNPQTGIVLLVDHKDYAVRITRARKIVEEEKWPYYIVSINGKDQLVVFRYVGDSYYDSAWEKSMIDKREKVDDRYMPDSLNNYYSLLYHMYVHNKRVNPLLHEMAKKYAAVCHYSYSTSKLTCMDNITVFLKDHGYEFVRPDDSNIYYNSKNIAIVSFVNHINERSEINNIVQIHTDYESLSDYLYFKGEFSGREVFIKYGGVGESCENEYLMTKRAYDCSPKHFVEPIVFRSYENKYYIVYAWVDGLSIDNYLKEHSENKEIIKMQIIDIFESLQKAQIMHRDIRPDNMLVVDGNIKLIDFQYAIDLKKPKELKCVKNNNIVARHLGNENFRYKSYGWKDSASIVKLLHYYGFNTDNIMLTKDKTFYMSLIQYCVASFEKLCLRTKRRLLIIMGTYDGSLDQYI